LEARKSLTEKLKLIYLAARYSRREELCDYRNQIQAQGHAVISRWLNGTHQISDTGVPIGDHGEKLVEGDSGEMTANTARLRTRFANEDLTDVRHCELLIAFTEPPRSSASRGGRHVELGIAIGLNKEVWIVGYRENIFCWLENVRFFETFEEVLNELRMK
jgi:nucleoside 2-deoxyribosyltransferase